MTDALPLVAGTLVLALGAGAVFVYRRRRTADQPTGAPWDDGPAAAARATGIGRPADTGGTDDGSSADDAPSSDGPPAGSPSAEPEPPTDDAPSTDADLLTDEERVIELLEANGGRLRQQDVIAATDWSRTKTSDVVQAMHEDGAIERYRLGRENVLALPGEIEV